MYEGTLNLWAKRGYLVPVKVGNKNMYAKSDVRRVQTGNKSGECNILLQEKKCVIWQPGRLELVTESAWRRRILKERDSRWRSCPRPCSLSYSIWPHTRTTRSSLSRRPCCRLYPRPWEAHTVSASKETGRAAERCTSFW